MTWRDRMRQASFRGVIFELQDAEHSGLGRRKSVHEVPGGDKPVVQDLGKATETVRVDAFVVGDDYDRQAEQLIAALQRPGAGELVHPQYGTRRATATETKKAWSNREQGLARFSITFILDPVELALSPSFDGMGASETAAAGVQRAARGAIAAAIGSSPSNRTLTTARSASRALEGELDAAIAGTSRWQGIKDRASRVAALVRRADQLSQITLRSGGDWASWLNGYQGVIQDLGGSFSDRLTAFRGLLDLVRRITGLAGAGDARAVRGAVAASTLSVATVAAAEVGTGWDSRSEAVAAQDAVLEQIDLLLEFVPDELAVSLEDLRVAAVGSIPAEDIELPELSSYTPAEMQPGILVSHQLYRRPDRGDEIARRNRVRHPGFLPAQRLEVVVHG